MSDDPEGQRYRQPTIYDVAREAGVSITTVSNVLNKPNRAGSTTRERVLRVADELGYVPKSEAATRARKGTGRIAVIAPFTAYPSYFRRLAGIMQTTTAANVELVLFDQESAATAESTVLASLPVRGRVDGVIVMGRPIEESIERRLSERGLPVIVVDSESARFTTITIDDVQGGRQAADHLLSLGHQRAGYILERQLTNYASPARRRLDGFTQSFRTGGGIVDVVECEGSLEAGRLAALGFLTEVDRPTVIMAHYDDLALGALRAARELRLQVPEDLSVMGYDDGPAAEAADLSTIRQPFEESGALAARMLLDTMTQNRPRSLTSLDTMVVPRRSTGTASPILDR